MEIFGGWMVGATALDALVDMRLEELPAPVRTWVDERELAESIRRRLTRAAQNISDTAAADRLLRELELQDLRSHDVMSCFLEGGSYAALFSVRFFGGDPSRPFIEVEGVSARPDAWVAALADMKAMVSTRYAALRPVAMRIFHGPDTALARAIRTSQATTDHVILAAQARDIARAVAKPAGVSVEIAKDIDWYETYCLEYQRLLIERESLVGVVEPEDVTDAEKAVAQGLCGLAYRDSSLSGIIMGRKGDEADVPCVTITERIVFGSARNMGLGSYLLSAFAGFSANSPEVVIAGSVSPENVWSIASAKRAGRITLGEYSFVSL